MPRIAGKRRPCAETACVVCLGGDDCGPVQHCDGGCNRPFHIDACARALGMSVDPGGHFGDLVCAECREQCDHRDGATSGHI